MGLLAVLALLAGGKKLRVIGRGKDEDQIGSLSLGFIIILAAILRGGPLPGCIVALISCFSSCIYPRIQSLHQFFFNLSLTAVQSGLAGITYVFLNGGSLTLSASYSLPAAVGASIIFFCVNSAGVAGIIALCSDQNGVALWWQTVLATAPPYIAGGLIIPLVAIFSGGEIAPVLGFGAPIAFLVYHSYAVNFALATERQHRIDDLQAREAKLAELYAVAERKSRQQKSLAHLSVLAVSEPDLDRWLHEVADTVLRTLSTSASSIVRAEQSGKSLRLVAGSGWNSEFRGCVLPGGLDSLSGYTLLHRSPMVVNDLRSGMLAHPGPLLDSHEMVSALTCPIRDANGGDWGVLAVSTKEHRDFTAEDTAYLQSVANIISLVLDRFRQAELVQTHSHEIDALNLRLQRAMAETHHRVKNNLQVVSALVDMQLMEGKPTIDSAEMHRLGQHVRSLATIHDLLTHEAKREGSAQFLSTKSMMDSLVPLVKSLAGPRALRYSADDTLIPVQLGTSLAVLLNELVSNAVKHGGGEIDVRLAVDGACGQLAVCDSGPGFPDDFDSLAAAHTGLELVESLSRWDLQGEPFYENRPEGGARVIVRFPLRRGPAAIALSRDSTAP
jgi:two-component sensor histidine kinase/uncharacterized protein YigA (DUF484 family)